MSTIINGVEIKGSVLRINNALRLPTGSFFSDSTMPKILDVEGTDLAEFKYLILFGEYVYQRDNKGKSLFWLLTNPDTDPAFLLEIGAKPGRYVRRVYEEVKLNKLIHQANDGRQQGSGTEMMGTTTKPDFYAVTDQWSIPKSALLAMYYISGEFEVEGYKYSAALAEGIHPVIVEINDEEYFVYERKN